MACCLAAEMVARHSRTSSSVAARSRLSSSSRSEAAAICDLNMSSAFRLIPSCRSCAACHSSIALSMLVFFDGDGGSSFEIVSSG